MYLFLTTSANTASLRQSIFWGEKMVRNCISGCWLWCDSLPLPSKSPIQTTVVLPSPFHVWLNLPKKVSVQKSSISLAHFGTVFSGESFQSPRHLLSWDAGNAHLALQPENSVSKTQAFSVQVWSTWDTYTIVTLHSREVSLLCIAIHRPLETTSENEASHLGNLVGKGPCEFQPKPSNHPGRGILSTLHCQKKWQHTF